MRQFRFQLRISSDEFLEYYRGTTQEVMVSCYDGLIIQFPASLLKKHVTADGVHGAFVLTCEDNCKGAKLQRLPGGPGGTGR